MKFKKHLFFYILLLIGILTTFTGLGMIETVISEKGLILIDKQLSTGTSLVMIGLIATSVSIGFFMKVK